MKTPILKLFTSYRRWTTSTMARSKYVSRRKANSFACAVEARDADACCWCLSGAVEKCYPAKFQDGVLRKLGNAAVRLFPGRVYLHFPNVVDFNDHPDTTFADVLKVVRHAKV